MANGEPAKAKTDVIAHLVQKARLQTTFSNKGLDVCHTVRNHTAEGSSVREYWGYENDVGCGGLGSLHLQKCNKVRVLWDDSDYEQEGDDRGAKDKIDSLRAVKRIQKPRDQIKLAAGFLAELDGLVSLTEPKYEFHFVQTYGWYESEQMLFIAMEHIALGDLQSHLVNNGPLKEADAKFISKQVLRGLEFMHGKDIVHRDLKPSHLLIKQMPPDSPWWIKISDFGLTKKLEQSQDPSSTVCGTVGFMAPELLGFSTPTNQVSRLDKWKAADIWAFGETVYRLLTGESSFGYNMQDLRKYSRHETTFPRAALKRSKVSTDGIEFIRLCMAPFPTDRPSANAALDRLGWPITHCENGYRNITTKNANTIPFKGKQPPVILCTPEGEHLLIIEEERVIAWNMKSSVMVHSYEAENNAYFCHGSIHPSGKFLCVTQTKRRNALILDNTTDPKRNFPVDDELDGGGSHPTISAFSPDGETLVTARNDLLCQIDIDCHWAAVDQYCVAANPNPNRDKCENRIKDLRFMKDGSALIVACHTQVVIMNTTTDYWFKKQVIEYPCRVSDLDISPRGNMVACGSTTGELWLWTSDMGCWVRRIKPNDRPGATSRLVDNVRFSARGTSILYNYRGRCGVNMCSSVPLDQVSFAHNLRNHLGRRMGHTITYPQKGVGVTALGGGRGSEIIFWTYEL